ncbi:hypothetical protein AMECASPLE_029562 [Ameca splendens]|uniref:Uncharacterized protein n=1 Tax=Ameca splendens TaxID=208324 RepID=A0ABV0Z3L9_9TELE
MPGRIIELSRPHIYLIIIVSISTAENITRLLSRCFFKKGPVTGGISAQHLLKNTCIFFQSASMQDCTHKIRDFKALSSCSLMFVRFNEEREGDIQPNRKSY